MNAHDKAGSKGWQPDRDSPVPLYLQIRQHLVGLIANWPDPDARFFTDEALSERFSVTKATVRQALSDLVGTGLLVRRRGAGTFVCADRHVEQLRPSLDIDRQYRRMGEGPTTRIDAYEERAATPAEARALSLVPGSSVLAIRRVRALAHVPIALDERVMSADTAGAAGFTRKLAAGSIVDRLRTAVDLGNAAWAFEARRAGELDRALLQVEEGDPILVRSLVYRTRAGDPVLVGETRHRSDLVRCGFEMDISGAGVDHAQDVIRIRDSAIPPQLG